MKNSTQSLGTRDVMIAGVALVVAASTLVSDFSGFFSLGAAFVVALVLGFIVNLLLAISASDLSVTYPRGGALFDYVRGIFPGKRGRLAGAFLGLTFFGMFAFAVAGETAAGAFALQALTGTELPIWTGVLILGVLAVIPNLFGAKTATWVGAGLLLLMLGIRWFFGLAGFLGISRTGAWSASHLDTGPLKWFGEGGVLSSGFAIAFWSFVGIEFACSLARDVKNPGRSMPTGLIAGLILILATSLMMGVGVTGTASLDQWRALSSSSIGAGGEAPQLAVGQAMFGSVGYFLMAISSVAATLGSLTVAYLALPRLLQSIAREDLIPAPLARHLREDLSGKATPAKAIVFTFVLFQIPALSGKGVIDWVFSAAYLWILLYLAFHGLAICNRLDRTRTGAFPRTLVLVSASAGFVLTLAGLYFAFAGAHFHYGGKAILILLAAGATPILTLLARRVYSKRAETAGTLDPQNI